MSEQETTVRERVMRWLSTPGVGILLAAIITSWFALTQVANFNASDVLEYEQYARAFWFGNPPFRALPFEYPPLALAPFTLTLFPAGAGPFVAFGLWMVGVAILVYLTLAWGWSRRAAVSFGVYLLVGAVSVALSRYDLVPVAFTVAAWLAAERKRFTLAYALLAVGVLLKLYPLFLFPVLVIAHWRSLQSPEDGDSKVPSMSGWRALWRVALSLAGPVAVMLLGFEIVALRDPQGALSAITFAQSRLIEVESIPATLLWAGTALGFPAYRVFSYAYNYSGALDAPLGLGSSITLVLGLLWVYWRMARGALKLPQAILAALCVVLVASKVLSAQYLLWILPFVAVVYELDLLWLAICVLTTLEYPILAANLAPTWGETYDPLFLDVLALRNALLVIATIRVIVQSSKTISPQDAKQSAFSSATPLPADALR
jgi:Glycosyltransferase family 87